MFYIMSSIAGGYFGEGVPKPARVMVSREFVRAFPDGLGEVKTAANYAISIYPQKLASQKECDQVLFLDAIHREYIDELGGMNFFAIRGNELLTPELNGCILHGITRRSIIEMAPKMGLKPIEARIAFSDFCKEIESGKITEAFACGTAAIVCPISEFIYQEKLSSEATRIRFQNEPKISLKILHKLSEIQRGHDAAYNSWIFSIP
ncbi:MAG: hypothetical protein A2Z20_11455 [Bdellovibrionales bacterium RBG_16_40_8]|nr:MAG: hypothetical protein A2Z20_11455 [Bdellovibrionales bacterium RBG_16_40_8]